jgi:toxin ParE1/3/4
MCCEIAINPSLGRSYNEVKDEILGFRMNQHIIFYKLINSDVIEIIRILHGKMDLKSRLDL